MRKHYTEAQRATLVDLVIHGRASARQAAAQLGVAESTAYYWIKRAGRSRAALALVPRSRQQTQDQQPVATPRFARLVRGAVASSSVTLRVGGVILEVRPGFDAALLREVIAALVETAQ